MNKELVLEKLKTGTDFVKIHKWKFIGFIAVLIIFIILLSAMSPLSEEDKARIEMQKNVKAKISIYDNLYDSIEITSDKNTVVNKLSYNLLKDVEYGPETDKTKLKFSSTEDLNKFEEELLSDPDSVYDNALLNFKEYISGVNKYLEPMTTESIGLSPKEQILMAAVKLYTYSNKETKLMRQYLDKTDSLSSIVNDALSDGAKATLVSYGATSMALLFSKT